jgi:hypothetical protein
MRIYETTKFIILSFLSKILFVAQKRDPGMLAVNANKLTSTLDSYPTLLALGSNIINVAPIKTTRVPIFSSKDTFRLQVIM